MSEPKPVYNNGAYTDTINRDIVLDWYLAEWRTGLQRLLYLQAVLLKAERIGQRRILTREEARGR